MAAPLEGWAAGWRPMGGDLVSGFDLVADELGLAERMEAADVVVTGEGFLDDESFEGKVVGGVAGHGRPRRVGRWWRSSARCSTA